jgi:small conductance mechanosensitive channel
MDDLTNSAMQSVMAALGARGLSIIAGILILGFGYAIADRVGNAARRVAERSGRIDETVLQLVTRIARIGTLGVAVLIALDKFGFDTTSLIAFVGALGVAIGLALKDTISDVAAGVVLVVLRPFSVGDAVDVGGTLGTVESIDLFETRIVTFDGIPTSLPNSKVRGGAIRNFSRAERRRFDLAIGVAYEADVPRAIELISGVLRSDGRVLEDPPILVDVQTLADSAVSLLVRGWTAPADFFVAQLELTRKIKTALDEAGVEIPYPKRSIVVTQGPSLAA